jgi:DNA-binding MarR family transcriptional regulator
MQGGISPDWLEVDLTMPQLKIMFLLAAHTRLRMSDLSRVLGKNLSTTTGVVDHLVQYGLLIRETAPDDRRVVIATITEKGRALCDSLLQVSSTEAKGVLSQLSVEDLRIVNQGMEIYLGACETHARQRYLAEHKEPAIKGGEVEFNN